MVKQILIALIGKQKIHDNVPGRALSFAVPGKDLDMKNKSGKAFQVEVILNKGTHLGSSVNAERPQPQ